MKGIVICRAGECWVQADGWCWGTGVDNELILKNIEFETLGDMQMDMARRQLEILFRTEGGVTRDFPASALVTFEARQFCVGGCPVHRGM